MKIYQVLREVDGFGNDTMYFENGVFLKEEKAIEFCQNMIVELYAQELREYSVLKREEEEAYKRGEKIFSVAVKPNEDDIFNLFIGNATNKTVKCGEIYYIEIEVQ